MTPVLGIIASSNQQGRAGGPVGAYDAIASITLASATTSITFAGIPQNYSSLVIRSVIRSDKSADTNADMYLTFNGDTSTSSYTRSYLRGNSSAASSAAWASGTYLNVVGDATAASSTAGIFSPSIIEIMDYTSSSKYKMTRVLQGSNQNTTTSASNVYLSASQWLSYSAITSLTFTLQAGTNFQPYTTISIYGVQ